MPISDDHMQAALAEVDAYFASERLAKAAPRMLELLRGLVDAGYKTIDVRGDEVYRKCFHCGLDYPNGHEPDCPWVAAKAFLAELEAGR